METIEELYKRSDYEFDQKLFQATKNGEVAFLEEFVNSNIKKDHMFTSTVWHMLEHACVNKQSEIVKYIIETECLIKLINRSKAFERCFQDSCKSGSLDIIKYLLDSKDEELDIITIAFGCRELIEHHHQDVLKYILNHEKSKEFLNYELRFPDLLQVSAQFNNVEALKYLITFPRLIENGKSYIYEHADKTLCFAIAYENVEVSRFLICEIDLKKTKDVRDALKNKPNKEITKIFKLKELNESLQKELISKGNSAKKIKL
jgi:hypothetical protein